MKKFICLMAIFLAGCSTLEETSPTSSNVVVVSEKVEVSLETEEKIKEETVKEEKKVVEEKKSTDSSTKLPIFEKGIASNYGKGWDGKKSASGEKIDNTKLTAAHKTLPFGTIVRVTNTKNGKSVDVRINDRGPFVKGRVIDLSNAAFVQLAPMITGLIPVEVRIVKAVTKK